MHILVPKVALNRLGCCEFTKFGYADKMIGLVTYS